MKAAKNLLVKYLIKLKLFIFSKEVLIICLVGMHFFSFFKGRDYFPFVNYGMYSSLRNTDGPFLIFFLLKKNGSYQFLNPPYKPFKYITGQNVLMQSYYENGDLFLLQKAMQSWLPKTSIDDIGIRAFLVYSPWEKNRLNFNTEKKLFLIEVMK